MTAGSSRDEHARTGTMVQSLRQQSVREGRAVLDVLNHTNVDRSSLEVWLTHEVGVHLWGPSAGDVESWRPDFEAWPIERAAQTRSVVLRAADSSVRLAMEDPWRRQVIAAVAEALSSWPATFMVDRRAMNRWLVGATGAKAALEPEKDSEETVVRFVDDALRRGFRQGASDVHFEVDNEGVAVRVRLDGVMSPMSRLDGTGSAQQAISRLKVLASLDITERRVPQDGRMQLDVDGASVDLRVSVMPSVHGEDAVLRLLDKAPWRQQAAVTMDALGFDSASASSIRALATLPSGMLLVTGPTGSGKTTTVYAVLSEVNSGQEKIVTIEDPVEYELPGVLQIPVNERKGLTFAKGLRSILRHDPDRILVGEIRDAETAEIAVQSSLTGHQVFTTVHANSIGDVVGRFRHFGIDMFGLMSALNGVVVQRLLRQLCPECRSNDAPMAADQEWAKGVGMCLRCAMSAVGCDACRGTGYKGRFGLAEVHVVDDELRDLVTTNAPLSALRTHSAHRSVQSLLSQASRCVESGRTTVSEVRRVVGGVQ